jgi:hypothetical protein
MHLKKKAQKARPILKGDYIPGLRDDGSARRRRR